MDVDVKEIEWLLFESKASTNQIANDTGIGVMTVSDIRNKKTDLLQIKLDTAIKLTAYALKEKERTGMDDVVKAKGLKTAVGEFNSWRGHAVINYNFEDNTVWTDVFANSNEQRTYQSDRIKVVHGKDDDYDRDDKTSMREVQGLIEEMKRTVASNQARKLDKEKRVKTDGLEAAVETFNNWQGAAAINYDLAKKTVWTDVFASWDEGKEYPSETVVKVYRKDAFFGQGDQIKAEKLQELIDIIKKAEGC